MTLASDLDPSPRLGPVPAPAAAIPAQAGPALTISLTDGCETPMDALKAAPLDRPVRCHPCDEAIVRLLIARVRRADDDLTVTTAVPPGTLCLG